MKVKDFIEQQVSKGSEDYKQTLKRQIEILLSDFYDIRIYDLYREKFTINKKDIFKLSCKCERIKISEPVEYILENAVFYGLKFKVNRDVLIPRPETELLVDYIIDKFKQDKRTPVICDMGTGSGNIAVSIAKNIDSKILAVDISIEAVNIAKQNADVHNVRDKIRFIVSAWFQGLKNLKFDIIAVNPPYISRHEFDELDDSVRLYEPQMALLGGYDGLESYRNLLDIVKGFLKKSAEIVMEIGWNQKADIIDLINKYPDFEISCVLNDYSGYPRIVVLKIL